MWLVDILQGIVALLELGCLAIAFVYKQVRKLWHR